MDEYRIRGLLKRIDDLRREAEELLPKPEPKPLPKPEPQPVAAQLDQLDCIGKRKTASSHESGIFTKTVACNESRLRAVFSLPKTPDRNGSSENGRLSHVGLVQMFFRAVLGQRPEVITERLGGLTEGVPDQRLLGAKLGEHGLPVGQ